jgi:hypothetical protein
VLATFRSTSADTLVTRTTGLVFLSTSAVICVMRTAVAGLVSTVARGMRPRVQRPLASDALPIFWF